jgi:YHS domain-containing protein
MAQGFRLLVAACGLLALAAPARAGEFFETDGVAIKGYDPVAYFTRRAAVAGSAAYTASYHGSVFRFADAADRDLFAANPEKYLPQYHGFCTFAVAEGAKAPSNPAAYRIINGKLYLNYNAAVAKRFDADVAGNLHKADTNWPAVQSKALEH